MFEFLELEETVGKLWHRLVGRTASLPSHPEHGVAFEEVKPYLPVCFRGFGGEPVAQVGPAHVKVTRHRLRLRQLVGLGEERTAWASRDDGSVLLPPGIDLFADRALNHDLYLWLTAYLAVMERAPSTERDPLVADIKQLEMAGNNVAAVLRQFPGLAPRYRSLCKAMLETRHRGMLPPVERLVENRIIGLLRLGAGLSNSTPPSILPWIAPPGYLPMLVVPLWPHFALRQEIIPTEREEGDAAANACVNEGQGHFQAERDAARSTDRSPFILNRFEKILAMAEMVNVDRPTDDQDDANKDAAKDLDEIRLGQRKERPSSKFRFDLDLPPEAADMAGLEGESLYPEWNYRKGAYMPAYCRIISGKVPVEAEPHVQADEEAALIRKVRKQFEVLRPRNEVLRAQLDGDELDLDAVVRMRADLAAGGDGTDRIHLASRPLGHDLAVSILVDVSLSTDAWIDNHRVLDVEKQALLVLANGLSAAGTHHSILTFTSRRRAWVRIETVKTFGEALTADVERRIASLKPGYYTRMGAAIRHASADLARQPNKTKLLLVLTDGKPNDIDHYEGRFALEDSRKAVVEARRAGQAVFAVTVDRDAKSYLPMMFGQSGFAVVGDIARLPRSLPAIYRALTR
ncbi:nitric oxide reductase activation protein NorD [Rhizobium alvei]|uniref:VWA domain-containing protein n=1 Tax=Rhizobium alvei TaxID=1132659 RepID=A0ABT8YSY9_9HYPH|nr:VWA domain-containing protein [Rhizobium alvei]MDO6966883.1 VWA domain-containing protein [Rhizobium alvei]